MTGCITTLELYFSTYDMIQLVELSCAIWDGAMPGFQQLLQMGACPLEVLCHACQACASILDIFQKWKRTLHSGD